MSNLNNTQLLEELLAEVGVLKTLLSTQNLRRIKMVDVAKKVGFCDAKIYNMINTGEFPKPKKDGVSAFWFEHEVDQWLLDRHKSS